MNAAIQKMIPCRKSTKNSYTRDHMINLAKSIKSLKTSSK